MSKKIILTVVFAVIKIILEEISENNKDLDPPPWND